MRLIQEKDLPDFETGHTENLRSAVRWVMKVSFIVLLYTFSNHSEEPECCNFLHDIPSSEVAPCLHLSSEIHKHFTRNISACRR